MSCVHRVHSATLVGGWHQPTHESITSTPHLPRDYINKRQPIPSSEDLKAQFQQWRQDLYNCFEQRSDTLMDLLDALASNSNARSVVELSLNPLFRRDYSALYKGIEHFFQPSSTEQANQERQQLEKHFYRGGGFTDTTALGTPLSAAGSE